MDDHADLPVYWVDVKHERALSCEIAGRLGITHESPQAILLRQGAPVWHDSHHGVTADAIARGFSACGMLNPVFALTRKNRN